MVHIGLIRTFATQNVFSWIKKILKMEKHLTPKYVLFEQTMEKYGFGSLLSRGILACAASTIYMALWNYLYSETLSLFLKGLEIVSKKSGSYSHREALEVSETDLTLSLPLPVKALASGTLLV